MSSTSSKSDNLLNSLTTDCKISQHPKAIAVTAPSIQPKLSVKKLVLKPSSYQELRRVLKKKNRQIEEARLAEIRTPKQARAAAKVAARQARDAAERARDISPPPKKISIEDIENWRRSCGRKKGRRTAK
jgi:hypothetical protein